MLYFLICCWLLIEVHQVLDIKLILFSPRYSFKLPILFLKAYCLLLRLTGRPSWLLRRKLLVCFASLAAAGKYLLEGIKYSIAWLNQVPELRVRVRKAPAVNACGGRTGKQQSRAHYWWRPLYALNEQLGKLSCTGNALLAVNWHLAWRWAARLLADHPMQAWWVIVVSAVSSYGPFSSSLRLIDEVAGPRQNK